ncbi:hypothetical protein CBR_g40010 [Chara braunii]|uniref:Uncharacterized protein n=1 Tax=Chara braunii TaxID=69332 RepID=A0A388LST1_CHABU|nr:hypothetical protein CBR_g40010 [Chara braunii]|eukprot:GBG85367.1 hypothetical protein CBR_g40010 [Chara braunii]
MAAASTITRIAIDPGTSSCAVAVIGSDGIVHVIPNEFRELSTPSFVTFTDKSRLVGQAQKQARRIPENVLYEVKRLIGRDYDSITEELRWWPFNVKRGLQGEVRIEVRSPFLSWLSKEDGDESGPEDASTAEQRGATLFAPEEILAMLLAKMKSMAESFLHCGSLCAATIAVPSFYNDRQRSATKIAAQIAGFTDVEFVNEATAAAVAYAHDNGMLSMSKCGPRQRQNGHSKVLIFSLGGGSLDVALVSIGDGRLTVDAVDGDTCLGGKDFDEEIIELIEEEWVSKFGKPLDSRKGTALKLKIASERAKRDLTSLRNALIEIELFDGQEKLVLNLEREVFERRCRPLFDRCLECFLRVAQKQTEPQEVQAVVLAGGSTRIPEIGRMLRVFFDKAPQPLAYQDEAIVRGAALFTACRDQILDNIYPRGIDFKIQGDSIWSTVFTKDGNVRVSPFSFRISNYRGEETDLDIFEGRQNRMGKLRMVDEEVCGVLEMDECGILVLRESGRSTVSLHKIGQARDEEIDRWKHRAQEMIELEACIEQMSREKYEWMKYTGEVDKRKLECPNWLRDVICSCRIEVEGWLEGAAGDCKRRIGKFREGFEEFKRLCELALGEAWARSLSGRKLFVACRLESDYIDERLRLLLKNEGDDQGASESSSSSKLFPLSANLCDIIAFVPDDKLSAARELIARTGNTIEVATRHSYEPPECLRDQGFTYVLVRMSGGKPGWNEVAGNLVKMSVQAGLFVIVCVEDHLDADDSSDDQCHDGNDRQEPQWLGQLQDLIRQVGSYWRNIILAYQPAWSKTSPWTFGSSATEDVLRVARHLRQAVVDSLNHGAAAATRIIFEGEVSEDIWHSLPKLRVIDGFLLPGDFQDSIMVDKLGGARDERGGKFIICGHADEGAVLGESVKSALSPVLSKLERSEEDVSIIIADRSDEPMTENEVPRGKVLAIWKPQEEHIDVVEVQLEGLRKTMEESNARWEDVFLEYRPAPDDYSKETLSQVVGDAHSQIRRWFLMHGSLEDARRVRIICFLDDQISAKTLQEIAALPNVDGISVRLTVTGSVFESSLREMERNNHGARSHSGKATSARSSRSGWNALKASLSRVNSGRRGLAILNNSSKAK